MRMRVRSGYARRAADRCRERLVKGRHLRFAGLGHNGGISNRFQRQVTEADYTPEDRGCESLCWIWNKSAGGEVHQMVMVGKRRQQAHRVVYEQLVGAIPEGFHLHHRCNQRRCVNPEHLQPLHPVEHGRLQAKVPDQVVAALREGASLKGVAEKFGVSSGHIRNLKSGNKRA